MRTAIAKKLPNEVYINGQMVRKERFGMASIHDENKTFTGEVLWTNELRKNPQGNCHSKSVEQKISSFHLTDNGIVVWNSNGQIPPTEWLLDFVQLGVITLGQAHISAEQKEVEQKEALDHLFCEDGKIFLKAEAFEKFEERMQK